MCSPGNLISLYERFLFELKALVNVYIRTSVAHEGIYNGFSVGYPRVSNLFEV